MAELSVIVPVLNERPNIIPLLTRLAEALRGIAWEVVFVDDDSADGTAYLCRAIGQRDSRVRVIQRIGRSGLASACVEGFLATVSPWIAVMDADLQHDESVLPGMLRLAKERELDVVVASRNVSGGSMGGFAQQRVRLSNLGRRLSSIVMRHGKVSDPMSGFFLLSRSYMDDVVRDLSPAGFKILVDLIASSKRPVKIAEVPYHFGARLHGESKLDTSVGVDFLLLIADKLFGRVIPVRFALYAGVGLTGVFVHLATLSILHEAFGTPLVQAQAFGTLIAITSNFFLNNAITYRDRKLRGLPSIVRGFILYVIACGIGLIANLALTASLVDVGVPWLLAGATGIIVSSVWNYGASGILAWKIAQRRRSGWRMAPAEAARAADQLAFGSFSVIAPREFENATEQI